MEPVPTLAHDAVELAIRAAAAQTEAARLVVDLRDAIARSRELRAEARSIIASSSY